MLKSRIQVFQVLSAQRYLMIPGTLSVSQHTLFAPFEYKIKKFHTIILNVNIAGILGIVHNL